jgi:septum formation protein
MKKIILASTSPGRKKALEDAGLVFDIVPSDFEEDMTLPLSPQELTIHLAQGKARAVAQHYADAIIIGADTVGVFENKVLGKPHTEDKSHEMLRMLSWNVHSMITGLVIIDTQSQKEVVRSVESKIWFRHIPHEEIVEYTKSGEALQKAGAYAYQLEGRKFVERTEGSESNIIGMPVEVLKEALEELRMQ